MPTAPAGLPPLDEPFEAVVARCEPLVRRTIRQVLGRHRDEDDLTQEVFLRLAIRMRQPGEVAVAAWVRRVARNVAIDELRRCRPDPVADDILFEAVPTGSDDAAVALEGAELGRIVHQAVQALPERQRLALLQRLDRGAVPGVESTGREPMAADGELLGVEARDSLVARARRQLRRDLHERWRVAAVVPGLGALRSLGGRIGAMGRRLARWSTGGGAPMGAKVAALVVVGAVGTGAGTWLASARPSGPGSGAAGLSAAATATAPLASPPLASPARPTVGGTSHRSPVGPWTTGAPSAAGVPATGGTEPWIGAGVDMLTTSSLARAFGAMGQATATMEGLGGTIGHTSGTITGTAAGSPANASGTIAGHTSGTITGTAAGGAGNGRRAVGPTLPSPSGIGSGRALSRGPAGMVGAGAARASTVQRSVP